MLWRVGKGIPSRFPCAVGCSACGEVREEEVEEEMQWQQAIVASAWSNPTSWPICIKEKILRRFNHACAARLIPLLCLSNTTFYACWHSRYNNKPDHRPATEDGLPDYTWKDQSC